MKIHPNHFSEKNILALSTYKNKATFTPLYLFLSLTITHMTTAWSAESDVLRPYGEYSFNHDSNALRLNTESPDSIQKLEAGIDVKKQISQQLITAKAAANRMWFNHYTNINNTGADVAANWNWHAGNHFSGNLGTSYNHSLAPFMDFNAAEKNTRSQRLLVADGTWRFHPSWQTHAGYTNYDLKYDLGSQKTLNRTDDTFELGVDYLPSTNSSVGLVAKHTKGNTPNPTEYPVGTVVPLPKTIPVVGNSFFVDNSYNQTDLMGKIDWHAKEKSRLLIFAGYTQRKHNVFSERNFNGFNARGIASWAPTSKLGLSLETWREIGSYSNLTTSYTVNRGVSLNPSLDLSAKLRLESALRYEKRDYLGDSMFAQSTVQIPRSDTARNASISLVYKPWQKVQMALTYYIDQRSSNYSQYYFKSNGIVFNTRYQF
jgi:exopolysaccharide biosynthesis operon protein EpsL